VIEKMQNNTTPLKPKTNKKTNEQVNIMTKDKIHQFFNKEENTTKKI